MFLHPGRAAVGEIAALREGDFSGLSGLVDLFLGNQQLTELPPGIFSGLSSLYRLSLSENQLTELPPDVFSVLSSLYSLSLENNQLRELPPGMFSGLSSMASLYLHGNPGSPFALTLELARTDSDDPTSPGPVTLEVRLTEGAPFAMTIPLSARGGTLSTSSVLLAAGTMVSTRATLTSGGAGAVSVSSGPIPTVCEGSCVGFYIVAGGPLIVANPRTVTLSVPAAYLTQGAQNLDGGVPLIAGRQALLRVLPTADEHYSLRLGGQATFFVHGREIYQATLAPPASGIIPIEVDEGRLGQSFNARIPGHVLQPGLEMVVELDPDGTLPLNPGSRSRFPESGRLPLDVRDVPPMHLTIVPVLYQTEVNRTTNAQVEDVARDLVTNSDGVLRYTRDVLPIGDLNVKLRDPYYTLADTMESGIQQIGRELAMLRHLEAGGDEYYHRIFVTPNTVRSGGSGDWPISISYRPGHVAASRSYGTISREYFAQGLGHNLSLRRAPCGTTDSADPNFPYADGSIGIWGHRFIHGDGPTEFGRLFPPESYKDLMSACSPRWISDYNFTKALTFRLASSLVTLQPPMASQTTTLLLWGGVRDGGLRLEPAFVHDARIKLSEVSGPYQLTGLDSQGRRLFSFSFTPDKLDDAGSNFLFAVPFEPEWTEDLDRVTLTGPEGSTTLDRNTGGRAAMIVDRATGQVRTIARDWSDGPLPVAMPANAQVEIIRGLPSR